MTSRERTAGLTTSANPLDRATRQPLMMLVDGYSMVYRGFYATRDNQMSIASTGEHTNAILVFMNMLLAALNDFNPTHCAIAFDSRGKTFRHNLYHDYKATRKRTPDELRPQFGRVRQLMETLGIPTYGLEGYEADDVLGTLSQLAEKEKLPTIILTGDRDLLQLVSPLVRVVISGAGKRRAVIYDEIAVGEQYGGLQPHQLADVKALQGDTSDNYRGVPGIGNETAPKLIQQFGGIEELLKRLEEVVPFRIRELLRTSKEQMALCLQLSTIVRNLPIDLDVPRCRLWQYDREALASLLRELNFTNMIARIPQTEYQPEKLANVAVTSKDYKTIRTESELVSLVEILTASDGFAFDTETTSLDPMQAQIVGLAFAVKPGQAFYIPLKHWGEEQVPFEKALELLRPVLENKTIPKIAHNANYDLQILANSGVNVRHVTFDTMVAAFLAGERALGLKDLAFSLLGVEMTPISDLIGRGQKKVTMDMVSVAKVAPYAAADADITWQMKDLFEPKLRANRKLWELFTKVEMPLLPVLVRMERHGITLDPAPLYAMGEELALQLSQLEEVIYETMGHRFKIRSPSQVADILFQELRLPGGKRTSTGNRFSTDASVLENLRTRLNTGYLSSADPRSKVVLDAMLEYREFDKLKSTYVDTLPTLVNSNTGRVHTSYNLAGVSTGRLSSNNPNLQNIPVKTKQGRQVRKAFVTQNPSRWILLSADYSQIELRVLAHLSQDPGLLEAFHMDEDIHAATAASIYGVPPNQVTSDMRRMAKVMNFGVVYGLSSYGIAQQTGLSRAEGTQFIADYFGKYPGIQDYLNETKRQAREQGYVETLLGRRRNLPDILSGSFLSRQEAERMAVNMPIQGTAADIIKVAMLRLDEAMIRQNLESRMLLQVHDELIFEVVNYELKELEDLIVDQMAHALELSVPLKVEVRTGVTWGDLK